MFNYFKLKEAVEDVKDSFSFGGGSEKLTSTAKLLGKTAANIRFLAIEGGIEVIKRLPEATGDMARKNLETSTNSLSEEKKKQMHELVRNGDDARVQRIAKEEAQREKEKEKSK